MFELIQPYLHDVLKDAQSGKLQLPDFQRGWVWEEDRIASLVASVVRRFPIGALLTLKTGGVVKFEPRVVEGVSRAWAEPEELLLDGQQRITSLFQALMRDEAVDTRTATNKKRQAFYYINIEQALIDPFPAEAVEIIDVSRTVRENIGRDVVLDLTTEEKEYAAMLFPVNRIFNHASWFNGWMKYWKNSDEKIELFQKFQEIVLFPIAKYTMPKIRLLGETSKEAVCLVFEKVNTGGKTLDAFELLTAMFAADGVVNLRTDWYGDHDQPGYENRLHEIDVLRSIERKDFLRAISLVNTYSRRHSAAAQGKIGKDLPAISCKYAALLDLRADVYSKWNDTVINGFRKAAKFLHGRGLFRHKDVPYPPQIIVLSALYALRGNKDFDAADTAKLEQWFWCGIFGELYGRAVDSRLANDIEDLSREITSGDSEIRTIRDAGFSESRLDTMRSRNSAAYKGVHVLLLKSGGRDFLTGEQIDIEDSIDIHHLFPQRWCKAAKIPRTRYNTVVNKTGISARTNKIIGSRAPSEYCNSLDRRTTDKGIPLDEILQSHKIDPVLLRADDFDAFYTARRTALLDMIEKAMGKQALRDGVGHAEDYDDDEIQEEDEEL